MTGKYFLESFPLIFFNTVWFGETQGLSVPLAAIAMVCSESSKRGETSDLKSLRAKRWFTMMPETELAEANVCADRKFSSQECDKFLCLPPCPDPKCNEKKGKSRFAGCAPGSGLNFSTQICLLLLSHQGYRTTAVRRARPHINRGR